MKGDAAKNARRKRRIEIMKAKRALCKASAASPAYSFLSLPPSSIYYNRKVGAASSTITRTSTQQTTTVNMTPTGNTYRHPTPTMPQAKQYLNTKGLIKMKSGSKEIDYQLKIADKRNSL
jgi:hypothetical protein